MATENSPAADPATSGLVHRSPKGEGGWRLPPATSACPRSTARSPIPHGAGFWRKMFAFAGPGYLVAVGYMDPGNWATDLAGGARFGYTLLSVIMISNLMAILLQALAARLGIASGRDLAQACRDQLLAAGHHRPLDPLRDRHRRLRPRRGARRRHRPQPALRPAAHLGRLPHGARRAHRPLPAAPRLPLRRGAGRRADRRSSPARSPSRSGCAKPDLGAVAAGFIPHAEILAQPARCSTSPSASSAPR